MAFVSPDLAESVLLTTEVSADGTLSTEGNLNDDNTGTEASAEIRVAMGGYKITHDLGFAVANLDDSNFSVRIFDGGMMDAGVCKVYPYQSDDANINTGNPGSFTMNDNGAYDTVLLSSGFVGDLEDVGTNQISIRLIPEITGVLRGRGTEIQIEFSEAAGGTPATVSAVAPSFTITPVAPEKIFGGVAAKPLPASISLGIPNPAIQTGVLVTPGAESLLLSAIAPVLRVGASTFPPAVSLFLSAINPTIFGGVTTRIPLTAIEIEALAPHLAAGVTIGLDPITLELVVLAPLAQTGVLVRSVSAGIEISPNAPIIFGGAAVKPPATSLTFAIPDPTITAGGGVTISPEAVFLTINTSDPTVIAEAAGALTHRHSVYRGKGVTIRGDVREAGIDVGREAVSEESEPS